MITNNARRVNASDQITAALQSGELDYNLCGHAGGVQNVTPSASGCEDCLKMGTEWVNLRICLTCGHVGCCDSSPNTHATKHYHSTKHPVIQSFNPGESWIYCYPDDVILIS